MAEFWPGSEGFPPEPSTPPPPRILLACQDAAERAYVAGLLEGAGVLADCSDDTAWTVSAALENHYQLIIVDDRLPALDGATAAELLSAVGNQEPIVSLTGPDHPPAPGSLCRPVQETALRRMLDELLAAPDPDGSADSTAFRDSDDFRRLQADYVRSLPAMRDDLRRAAAAHDHPAIRALAHRLKGTAANLALTGLSESAARLEQASAAQSGGPIDAALTDVIKEITALLAGDDAIEPDGLSPCIC